MPYLRKRVDTVFGVSVGRDESLHFLSGIFNRRRAVYPTILHLCFERLLF